jgi:hypothetical protein
LNSIIATQVEQIQKLGEFGPLVQAAKGELVGRLNTNDRVADVLKSAKLALEQENDSVVGEGDGGGR